MATTLYDIGTLSNRELQVYSAYNEPTNGYIPLLQNQIDLATSKAALADTNLQSSTLLLNALKQGLANLKVNGVITQGLPNIKNWSLGYTSFNATQVPVANKETVISFPATMSVEAVDQFINQAKAKIEKFQTEVKAVFDAAPAAGLDSGNKQYLFSIDKTQIGAFYADSFGKEIADLQNVIKLLKLRVTEYTSALVSAEAAVDSQEGIVANAQASYVEAAALVADLNKQMTQLQLKFQTAMSEAAGVNAASTEQAIKLQLINDVGYQSALLAEKEAEAQQQADLQQAQIESNAEVQKSQLEQAGNIELAKIQAATAAAQVAATQAAAADAATKEADKAKTRMYVLAGIVGLLVFGIITAFIFTRD